MYSQIIDIQATEWNQSETEAQGSMAIHAYGVHGKIFSHVY